MKPFSSVCLKFKFFKRCFDEKVSETKDRLKNFRLPFKKFVRNFRSWVLFRWPRKFWPEFIQDGGGRDRDRLRRRNSDSHLSGPIFFVKKCWLAACHSSSTFCGTFWRRRDQKRNRRWVRCCHQEQLEPQGLEAEASMLLWSIFLQLGQELLFQW